MRRALFNRFTPTRVGTTRECRACGLRLYGSPPRAWGRRDVGSYSGSGRVGGLAGLGNWILDKLERAILDAPELQEHLAAVRTETRDELAEERGFHERFIESRTRVYVRRRELRDRLAEFVKGSTAQQCLVTGPSGSGKSAALARFVRIWRRARRNGNVIVHFVGASPRSTGLRDVLRHLCAELRDALKLEDEIKQDTRELCDQFREFLGKVPADRRVVLVIDALNQLDEADNAHSLYWLPGQIPPPVRLIVSCIDDPDRADQPALAAMRSRQPHEIKVGLLTDEERLGIVREIPSVAAKTLDEQQVRLLLANAATRNPLFLLVALEELRGFGSFEQLNQKISGLPQTGNTLTAIFQQVIQRLGEDFNAATVKDVLTLLACARRGLSERELLDLIRGRKCPHRRERRGSIPDPAPASSLSTIARAAARLLSPASGQGHARGVLQGRRGRAHCHARAPCGLLCRLRQGQRPRKGMGSR